MQSIPTSESYIGAGIQKTLDLFRLPNELKLEWNDKYILPLSTADDFIMAACGAMALAVLAVAIRVLGQAFIPIGIVFSASILLCGGALVRHRSRITLSKQAVAIVDLAISAVDKSISLQTTDLNKAGEAIDDLKSPKYDHIRDDINGLIKAWNAFIDTTTQSPFDDRKTTFLSHLQGFKKQVIPYSM